MAAGAGAGLLNMQFIPYPQHPPRNVILRDRKEVVHFNAKGRHVSCSCLWKDQQLTIDLSVSGTGTGVYKKTFAGKAIAFWGLRHYYDQRDAIHFITFWSAMNSGQFLNAWLFTGHGLLYCKGAVEGDPARLRLGQIWSVLDGQSVPSVPKSQSSRPVIICYVFDSKHRDFTIRNYQVLKHWPKGYY